MGAPSPRLARLRSSGFCRDRLHCRKRLRLGRPARGVAGSRCDGPRSLRPPLRSEVEHQGYYRDPDVVAAYEREFAIGGTRLGGSSLLFVSNDLGVERTEAAARSAFATLRSLLGKKAFRDTLAREIAGEVDTPVTAVTVGRPRTVRIGDGTVSLPMRVKAEGLVFQAVLTFMQVDRVLGIISYVGDPERKIYNADVDRLARVSAARMTAGLVPTLKLPPAVSGTVQPGQVLSATRGTWTGDQLAFAYQWERCDTAGARCAPIPGATATTYTVASGDLASTLRVTVVGRNRLGSASSSSVSTPVVAGPPGSPTATVTPLITGTVQAGAALTVDAGGWAGSPTSFAYQWRRCDASGGACGEIAGATASTYTVATADSRSTLRALVIATNASGSGGAISAPTAVVP